MTPEDRQRRERILNRIKEIHSLAGDIISLEHHGLTVPIIDVEVLETACIELTDAYKRMNDTRIIEAYR